jgi:heavy metal sensor kinase
MKNWPIRWRLTAWYAVCLAGTLLLFGALVDALMHQRLLSRTDFELDEELHEVALEATLAGSRTEFLRQLQLRFGDHKTYEFQVFDVQGQRLYTTAERDSASVPVPAEFDGETRQFQSARLPHLGDSRIASQQVPMPDGPLIIQVIFPLGGYVAELSDLRWLMLTVGPLMVLLSVAGGYWLARRSLAPVDQMSRSANRITAGQLDERLAIANPEDELGHLASTFNAMLDRLEGTITELRQFTADAAHEIRTPLAVIRSAAEVALHSPRSASYYQECLQSIAEDTNRLTTLSDQLLLLAKEDAGLAEHPLEDIDLTQLVEQVATDLEPLADEKSVTIIRQRSNPCQVRGDTQRLRRVFLNLVDNAIKFTPPGGEISISQTSRNGLAEVTVADTGCGVAASHIPHIFDRFYRHQSRDCSPPRRRDSSGQP